MPAPRSHVTLAALGNANRIARRQRGLTQSTLAARALDESYISLVGAGRRNPTLCALLATSDAIGDSLPQLVRTTFDELSQMPRAGRAENAGRRYGMNPA